MPKPLYSLNPDNGAVVRFDEAFQPVVGAVQDVYRPRMDKDSLSLWFKLDGELYCAFLTSKKTVVAKLNNSDLTPVVSIDTEVCRAAWGEPINWGGAICWLERLETGEVYLYKFNGSELTYDEIAGVPAVSLPLDKTMEALNLSAHGQALEVLPSCLSGSPLLPNGSVIGRCWRLAIHERDGRPVATATPIYEGYEPTTLNAVLPTEHIAHGVVSEFRYGSDLIRLTIDGTLSVGAKHKDIRRDRIDHIPVQDGDPECIVLSSQQLARLGTDLLGGRLTDKNGQSRTIIGFEGRRLTTTRGAAVERNDEFSFAPGFGFGSTTDMTAGVTTRAHWVETSKGVVGVILGRSRNSSEERTAPTVFASVGSEIRTRELPPISVFGSCVTLDPTDNSITLVFQDGVTGNVKAVKQDIGSGVFSPSVVVYPQSIRGELPGVSPGSFLRYEAGEPDARVESISYDADAGVVKLTIKAVNAEFDVEYTKGSKWLKADKIAKTDDGVLHYLRKEEPGYIGPIQYRLVVRRA
jgi:hypothetical protein